MSDIRLLNGDAYQLIKDIPDKAVDLIVTDPPYEFGTDGIKTGIFKDRASAGTYQDIADTNLGAGIDLAILDEFVRVMKKINIYIWCNKEQIYDYMTYFVKERNCNFEFIIWAKTNPPPFVGGHYLKDKEYCLYFWEKGVKLKPTFESGKTVYISNLNVRDKKDYDHPTIKPTEIIENLIKNSCGGGLILDPFMGSGTTGVACKSLGVDFVGFEIDKKYYDIAVDRLNGITQKEKKSGYVQERMFEL